MHLKDWFIPAPQSVCETSIPLVAGVGGGTQVYVFIYLFVYLFIHSSAASFLDYFFKTLSGGLLEPRPTVELWTRQRRSKLSTV